LIAGPWQVPGGARSGDHVVVSLLRRIFLANAAIFAFAAVALVISPATVSPPVAATEAAVVVFGLVAMLALNQFSDTELAEIFLHHRVRIVRIVDNGHVTGIITREDYTRAPAQRILTP
jgi:hypothetical protein